MPQAADADDANPVGRPCVHHQRREDGDARAEKRACFGGVELLRKRDGPGPVRAHMRREPTVMSDNGELRMRAKVMAPRHALAAVHAASGDPPYADPLSDL